jgi:hypothetical protein
MQLLKEHFGEDARADGKSLDEMLMAAFANGTALRPSIANELSKAVDELPDWDEYQDRLIARVYSGVDGIGNESIDAFEKLNKRIDGLEQDLSLAIRNTVALSKMFEGLTTKVVEQQQRGQRVKDADLPQRSSDPNTDEIPF